MVEERIETGGQAHRRDASAATSPHARTIQLLSGNPLALPAHRLAPILQKIREYLPDMEYVYTAGRVTDLRNKTVR